MVPREPKTAMTLCDVAEIANHLWGFDTEGGRLYPRPIERAPMLLARQVDGSAATVGRPEDIETLPTEWEDAMFMILMAFPGDELWGIPRTSRTLATQPDILPGRLRAKRQHASSGPLQVRGDRIASTTWIVSFLCEQKLERQGQPEISSRFGDSQARIGQVAGDCFRLIILVAPFGT
jgi:hypothetical protein